MTPHIRSPRMLFQLLIHSCLLIRGMAATEPIFELPVIDFADLYSLDESTAIFSAHQFIALGAVQIVGIPNFSSARAEALSGAASCLETAEANGEKGVVAARMSDGSIRRTIAAVRGGEQSTPLLSSAKCGDSAGRLRVLVDSTAQQLFRLLDRAALSLRAQRNQKESASDLLMRPAYASFEQVAVGGRHLEHLHVYYNNPNNSSTSPRSGGISSHQRPGVRTVPLHTDSGLFVAMTTGLVKNAVGVELEVQNELFMELPGGSLSRASSRPGALLVLAGEGAAAWLQPVLGAPLRAVPHALSRVDGKGGDGQSSRAWFGLMLLPPADALVPLSPGAPLVAYREFRARELAVASGGGRWGAEDGLPSACGSSSRPMLSSEAPREHVRMLASSLCSRADGSSGVMCWTQCQAVEDLPCGADAVCTDVLTHEEVDGGECFSEGGMGMCQLSCQAAASTAQSNSEGSDNSFCRGGGTDMHMDGFTWALTAGTAGASPACLILFVSLLLLDSWWKFIAACVAVFCLGLAVEYFTSVRRKIFNQRWSRRREASALCLHGLQLSLAYLLMLAAMTYSAELFCAAVLGLSTGHAIFNRWAPPPMSAEPCCLDDSLHLDSNYLHMDRSLGETRIDAGDDVDHRGSGINLAVAAPPPFASRKGQQYQKII